MDMRKLVGQNVRRIRLEKGLTQEQFCDLSGLSQQYVSGLETGRRNPTIVTIYELAKALGVGHLDMAGVAFAVEGDGVGFATESYAASALYTTLASLSGALWRIRRASS
jgi:transcriptional regulator with XRE-family HTH domain